MLHSAVRQQNRRERARYEPVFPGLCTFVTCSTNLVLQATNTEGLGTRLGACEPVLVPARPFLPPVCDCLEVRMCKQLKAGSWEGLRTRLGMN